MQQAKGFVPSKSQEIGEFVTGIRRLFREKYYDVAVEFLPVMTSVKSWYDVGIPSTRHDYSWVFSYKSDNGLSKITYFRVCALCDGALKMAEVEKTTEEEFREIGNTLNDLQKDRIVLDALIFKARNLNQESDALLGNLRLIAEQLIN